MSFSEGLKFAEGARKKIIFLLDIYEKIVYNNLVK